MAVCWLESSNAKPSGDTTKNNYWRENLMEKEFKEQFIVCYYYTVYSTLTPANKHPQKTNLFLFQLLYQRRIFV